MQSKKSSLLEAAINTGIGFLITTLVAYPINWVCGIKANHSQVWLSVTLFTIVSIIRNYVIRRWFNKKENGKTETT